MPFTELEERLNKDGTPKPGYEPYNQIDEIAMHHDYNYKLADEGIGTRHEADKKMLDELKKVKTKGIREKIDYAIVKPIIWIKYKLGLGLQEAKELHKAITRKFKRRRIFVSNINKIWSADLMDKQKLSKDNKNYKYLLNVIDLFSRYGYSIALKSKSKHEVMNAFAKLFIHEQPEKLWTDMGTEFTNKVFKKHLRDRNIHLYHVHNEGKACVAERFNRTLGDLIQRHLTASKSKNYINKLDELLSEYNNANHSAIKMSPIQAKDPKYKDLARINMYGGIKTSKSKPRFNIGDRVRIYSYKPKFAKGSAPNWTKEIFEVSNILNTNPITYNIKDLNGEDITGGFYTQEMQKTRF